ncbi:MAG TPA: hypothetical protein DD379_19535 [Cyanobacteria bacterium UBA11162]|nr:hypothetical protein [Cyanobacteria bacterium UBA11162]
MSTIESRPLTLLRHRSLLGTWGRLFFFAQALDLSKIEQIILTLVYLHHLPTLQMLGIQFGLIYSPA